MLLLTVGCKQIQHMVERIQSSDNSNQPADVYIPSDVSDVPENKDTQRTSLEIYPKAQSLRVKQISMTEAKRLIGTRWEKAPELPPPKLHKKVIGKLKDYTCDSLEYEYSFSMSDGSTGVISEGGAISSYVYAYKTKATDVYVRNVSIVDCISHRIIPLNSNIFYPKGPKKGLEVPQIVEVFSDGVILCLDSDQMIVLDLNDRHRYYKNNQEWSMISSENHIFGMSMVGYQLMLTPVVYRVRDKQNACLIVFVPYYEEEVRGADLPSDGVYLLVEWGGIF